MVSISIDTQLNLFNLFPNTDISCSLEIDRINVFIAACEPSSIGGFISYTADFSAPQR